MRAFLPVLLVLLFSLGDVKQVRGEEHEDDAPHQLALSLGHQALQHFARGEFAVAREKFEDADRLAHSPVFVLYQARSERKLGHLLRARELLDRCAEEEITSSSPEAWRKAIVDAVAERDQLLREIPRVRFVVTGGAVLPIRLSGNGQQVSVSEPEVSISFDPGPLHLVAEDAASSRLEFDGYLVAGRGPQLIELSFPRLTKAPSRPVVPAGPDPFDPVSKVPRRPYRSGAHAAFLLGGSAFLFSAVATSIAVVRARQIKSHCVDNRCRPEDQEKAQSALRWANMATAGVVVGATGVISGVGLLMIPEREGAKVALSGHF